MYLVAHRAFTHVARNKGREKKNQSNFHHLSLCKSESPMLDSIIDQRINFVALSDEPVLVEVSFFHGGPCLPITVSHSETLQGSDEFFAADFPRIVLHLVVEPIPELLLGYFRVWNLLAEPTTARLWVWNFPAEPPTAQHGN